MGSPRPTGKSLGMADLRTTPLTLPHILSRAWRQWFFLGTRQACTLDPVSWMHNAQEAAGAGGQGPLMPVPSGSPCQASQGQLKRLDSVLGHSQALFLSQGWECVTLLPVHGGPWRGEGANRAFTVSGEGSPRGSRLQPAPRGGALHKPPTRKG